MKTFLSYHPLNPLNENFFDSICPRRKRSSQSDIAFRTLLPIPQAPLTRKAVASTDGCQPPPKAGPSAAVPPTGPPATSGSRQTERPRPNILSRPGTGVQSAHREGPDTPPEGQGRDGPESQKVWLTPSGKVRRTPPGRSTAQPAPTDERSRWPETRPRNRTADVLKP